MNRKPTARRSGAPGARLCPPRTSRSGPDHAGRARISQRLRSMRTSLRPEGRAPGAWRSRRSGSDHAGRARIFQRLCSMRMSLRPEGRASWSAAPSLVPEGRQQRLAGGKSAGADAAPGWGGEGVVPRRGIGEEMPNSLARTFLSRHGAFFDAPPGQGSTNGGNRGRRSLPRTCPRLISCGVPPGRSAGVPPAAAPTTQGALGFSNASVPCGRFCGLKAALRKARRSRRSGCNHAGRSRISQHLRSMRTSLRPEGRAPGAWRAGGSRPRYRRRLACEFGRRLAASTNTGRDAP